MSRFKTVVVRCNYLFGMTMLKSPTGITDSHYIHSTCRMTKGEGLS